MTCAHALDKTVALHSERPLLHHDATSIACSIVALLDDYVDDGLRTLALSRLMGSQLFRSGEIARGVPILTLDDEFLIPAL